MSFQFGNTSRSRLLTCHADLQAIFTQAIGLSDVDFGIAYGHRSTEVQQKLYAQGRTDPGDIVTNVDGIPVDKGGRGLSTHNHTPSRAVDVYAWVNGKASWDRDHLVYIGGVVMATAKVLHRHGQITHRLRWGGNWDGDGEIISDQNLMDLPHFELIM